MVEHDQPQVELFRERLEQVDGRLLETESLAAARAAARALVGEATVARWADHELDEIALIEAPAAEAEYSLIRADVAVAASGAIGFAHGTGRGRAAGILPPRQIALLAQGDLVATLEQALARLYGSGPGPSNVVFVAGPSRTSDIEQRSIRGVHAPRELDVIMFRP